MACRMNSEKWVFRARHSDSTMARSDGLMRKPLISVCLHLFSFNAVFSYASVVPDRVFVFIELLDVAGLANVKNLYIRLVQTSGFIGSRLWGRFAAAETTGWEGVNGP